jgi:DUF4097 and DUF4098 domain-containing protein YvlB
MKRKYILGIFALVMILILGVSISAWGFNKGFMHTEKEEFKEKVIEFKEAILNEDYEAWKALMEEKISQMREEITEENFNELVEKYKNWGEKKFEHKGFAYGKYHNKEFKDCKFSK